MFSRVRGMDEASLRFGQMETVLTDHDCPAPAARLAMRSPPETASALSAVGFDVMSVAGNHAMDFGARGLTDTIRHLGDAGIATCGGGETLVAARRSAVIEVGGRRVAVLAYSSILPAGYAAETNRPGCAPMWAHTHYEQVEPDQPGTPARVRSFADPDHLSALVEDVRGAKAGADIVVLSLHWGVHFVRSEIADYQFEVARAAVGAGADMIFGHHPHLLKGVELIDGKPVFYSLGNFAIEQPSAFREDIVHDASFANIRKLGGEWKPGEDFMLPEETRPTMVACCDVSANGDVEVSFYPHWVEDDSAPVGLAAVDPRFEKVRAYTEAVSREAGMATRFVTDGDVVRVY